MADGADDLPKQLLRDWVRRRAEAVRGKYEAYDALLEIGVEGIVDQDTPVSVFCPFHPNKNTPAARYYPPQGRKNGYLRCFAEKENWDSINLYAKARGKRFMDALQELERRFRIHVPKRPELPEFVEPSERGANYESEQWADVPRVLKVLEDRLLTFNPGRTTSLRDKVGMTDFVRFCRVADAVTYDFDKTGKATPEMSAVLRKLMARMDEAVMLYDMQEGMEQDDSAQ